MRGFLAFLAVVSLVGAQPQGCSLPDTVTLQSLVTQLRAGAFVQLSSAPAYKCQATGGSRGAYSYFSVVLHYQRDGTREVGQFDASCLDGEKWTGIGATVITDPTSPVIGAQLNTGCLQCVRPNVSDALLQNVDPVTHCLPCPNSCKGLNQCSYAYGNTDAICCNYYSPDGSCLEQCPSSLLPNQDFLCSIVVGFSTNADAILRRDLPYQFTIYISSPFPRFSDTNIEITGGTRNISVPLPDDAILIQDHADIADDQIALEDPITYTLVLHVTSTVPLVTSGQVGSTLYYPSLTLTVIDDNVVAIGFATSTTTINWDIAVVTIVSSIAIAKPLLLQLSNSVTGINWNVTAFPSASNLEIQFPIPLIYSDIVSWVEGNDLTISLTSLSPNPYVVIGEMGLFAFTQLTGTRDEEVTIGFNTSTITASEGDGDFAVTVVARFNTTLVKPISVLLSGGPGPQPSMHMSAGVKVNELLTFDNNTSIITITIPITNDRVALETDEIYNLSLALVHPDPRVHLDITNLMVTIEDSNVVYIAMATKQLAINSEALLVPVCVNRSGAESLARPLPFLIQITAIQANHSIITKQYDGHFEPNDTTSTVCVSVPNFSTNGGLVAMLLLSDLITRGVSLKPDSIATIINFTIAEHSIQPLVSSVRPLASSVPPLASSVPPLVSSVPPLASSVPPLASSVSPLVSSVRPSVTSNLPPLASSVPPLASSVPPLVSSVRPLASSVPPLASSVPPLVSSVPPLVSSVPPLVSSVPPLVSSVPPLVSSVPPLVSSVPPLVSSVPPLASSVPPLVSSVRPLASSQYMTSKLPQPSPSPKADQPTTTTTTTTPLPTPPPTPQPPQLVNDTMVADPLFTVPLLLTSGGDPAHLCYEVHGQAGSHYNLISDSCISVNAFYVGQGTLNVINAIGIKAVDEGGSCMEVKVNISGECTPYVNQQRLVQYRARGVTVARYGQKVRVSVPNCQRTQLVMWVTCVLEGPYKTLQFAVTRGLNLSPTSHGLIGQFWSVPVTKQPYQDQIRPVEQEFQTYLLTVYHPDSPPRSFVATQYSQTWERTPTPCYYAGSSQGGLEGPSHDSVIEGRYSDYQVSTLESTLFKYSKFNQTMCAASR